MPESAIDTPSMSPIAGGLRGGGAPAGNINNLKNGTRVVINRLTLGELPAKLRRQLAAARHYRRGLEQIVASVKGEVSLLDAHLIDEAAVAECHSEVCRYLLRNRLDEMSTPDIIACSGQVLKSKGIRNAAVRRLNLDRSPKSVIDALYADATSHDSTPGEPDELDATDQPSDEPNASGAILANE